jgi:hypothetical protein
MSSKSQSFKEALQISHSTNGYREGHMSTQKSSQNNGSSSFTLIILFGMIFCFVGYVALTFVYGGATYQNGNVSSTVTTPKIEVASVLVKVTPGPVEVKVAETVRSDQIILPPSEEVTPDPVPVFVQEKPAEITKEKSSSQSSQTSKGIQAYPLVDIDLGYDCYSSKSFENGFRAGDVHVMSKGGWFTIKGCMVILASEVAGINGEDFVFEVINPEDPMNTSFQCPTVGDLSCVSFMNEIAKNPVYADKRVMVYTKVGGFVSIITRE